MTHAYSEVFLDDAMDTLGSAVEYAVISCGMNGQEFLNLFIASGIAGEFGRGSVTYISGMSGIELAQAVFRRTGKSWAEGQELAHIDYPAEYWVGWILAFYQWESGKSFETICRRIPYQSIVNLYGVLHEADPSKAVMSFNAIMDKDSETNLARLRKQRGYSQSQLARAAQVSLRSIQLYEQRQNDINNAQYNNLSALAKAIGCTVEDLLE